MEGVSIGWNCNSATTGVTTGLRKTKANGYKTCPFDEMVTNFDGMIECINDDFKYLCDSKYLKIIHISPESKWFNTHNDGDNVIYNTKYKFIFNHESPGHADLYKSQDWKNGINHFVLNDFEELKNRYNRRIDNLKELLNSGKFINFILTHPDTKDPELDRLKTTIRKIYPNLKFDIVSLSCDKKIYEEHLELMNR